MSLVSTGFLLFLLAGVIVYYIIPKKMQWVWLLVLSCFYYLCSGYKTIIFIRKDENYWLFSTSKLIHSTTRCDKLFKRIDL